MMEVVREYTNRLAGEASPYLLQHAHNPVDWYPWGGEALERARTEDKPIFLSIGYAACHWCHVMERESFENLAVAELLNRHFVSIKVDREERPDLDDIFMRAVVAMTGGGGWPMSVFLTPEKKPFFAGTYFPPEDSYGRPGFVRVLTGIVSLWKSNRRGLLRNAEAANAQIAAPRAAARSTPAQLDSEPFAFVLNALRASFDSEHGGWSGAPKFPSAAAVSLLLRIHFRTGAVAARDMALYTLDCMAAGGLYDHLGGGFHRYSVDAEWHVPHFEKMLYDNAQLALAYIEAYQVSGRMSCRRIAEETLDYLLCDLRDPSGGFHSSEDADSGGEEGSFYLWRYEELRHYLGAEEAAYFAETFGVREGGNFSSHEFYHHGQNALHRAKPIPDTEDPRIERAFAVLREVRQHRVRPGRDDKLVAAWNGLAVTSFARAAQTLGALRFQEAALAAGNFLRTNMMRGDTLLRSWRHGEGNVPGFLDDYGSVANAFIDLYETCFASEWLEAADRLIHTAVAHFTDEEQGGFFQTETTRNPGLARLKPLHDGQEPSGNTLAAQALFRLAVHLDKPEYETRACDTLACAYPDLRRMPWAYLNTLNILDFAVYRPFEIAIVAGENKAATNTLLEAARHPFLPARVIAAQLERPRGASIPILPPSLKNKPAIEGQATAYICRNRTCAAPVFTPEALREALRNRD